MTKSFAVMSHIQIHHNFKLDIQKLGQHTGGRWSIYGTTLQWRHNGRDSVPNHQPHDCILNRLFRSRSKKTSKLRVTGLCAGNSPGTDEFPAQMASNAENVSIWWRHHVIPQPVANPGTPGEYPSWESKHDIKESEGNIFKPILKENVQRRKRPERCLFAEPEIILFQKA